MPSRDTSEAVLQTWANGLFHIRLEYAPIKRGDSALMSMKFEYGDKYGVESEKESIKLRTRFDLLKEGS